MISQGVVCELTKKQKKTTTHFQVVESVLLWSSLTPASESKSRLFQESVWGESNASWQWIVSIDSTTANSLPLHRAPCMSLSWVFFFFFCVRACAHPAVDSLRTKKIHPGWEFISTFVPALTSKLPTGRKPLDLFIWRWLGVTDYFRARQRFQGQEGHVYVDWWNNDTDIRTPPHTNKQKMYSRADLRPEVLSSKSRYDLLFSESIESASMHSDSRISVRSPEEEWSCNVIYLQASVNVSSRGSTKLR